VILSNSLESNIFVLTKGRQVDNCDKKYFAM